MNVRGGEGTVRQVCYPNMELVMVGPEKDALFEIHGMLNLGGRYGRSMP